MRYPNTFCTRLNNSSAHPIIFNVEIRTAKEWLLFFKLLSIILGPGLNLWICKPESTLIILKQVR